MHDEHPPMQNRQEPASPFNSFIAAIQFLTIFPPLIRRPLTPQELGKAVGFYPIVGALIGLILLGFDYFAAFITPLQLRSALVLALWVLLTGALHIDGLLDAFDGLLGGHTPELRLEIMHDERIGAYGFAGGILVLLTKYSALISFTNPAPALILAPTLGRWGMAAALFAFPYARVEGLGRQIKDYVARPQIVLATLAAITIALFAAGAWGILAFGLAALTVWLGALFTMKRIPGMTGDTYGALNELVEVVVLIVLLCSQTL